jgi:hypothetical protein
MRSQDAMFVSPRDHPLIVRRQHLRGELAPRHLRSTLTAS